MPVPNATVQVLQANRTEFQNLKDADQTTQEAIDEAKDRVQDPEPDFISEYREKFETEGTLDQSRLEDADGEYVVAHSESDWEQPGISFGDYGLSSPSLGSPMVEAPADEPIILSMWDASAGGIYTDVVDRQLPGGTTNGEIQIQQIGPGGSVIDNFTTETEAIGSTGLGKQHEAVHVNLSPGLYRIQPADGGVENYLIVGGYGELMSVWEEQAKDRVGDLTNRSQYIQDRIDDGRFVPERVETNATGHFDMQPGDGVEDVMLVAYKGPVDKIGVSPENLTMTDMRQWYEASSYNGSFHIPAETKSVTVGNESQDLELETIEVSNPAYTGLDKVDEAWAWFESYLDDHTYAEAMSALQQRLDDLDDEELREHYLEMYQMVKENKNAQDRAEELLGENEDLLDESGAENATRDELKEQINDLERSLEDIENSIEAGDGSSEIVDETLSAEQAFDADLDPENVHAIVHFANGTSTTVPADSDYITIDSNTFGDDTVRLEDYPVGDSAAVSVEWRVVTEDGVGEARDSVRNPDFSGDVPELDAVDLSSLNPGPDETIDVRAHPSDEAAFGSVEGVTAHGPDGNKLDVELVDGETARFATNGAGVHHVSLTYSNLDGHNFTTSFRVLAGEENRDMPASIRAQQSPLGTYAITGDKLDGGEADVSNGGANVRIAGRIPSDGDPPGTMHVHTHGLSLAPDATTDIAVLRGDAGKTVSKNVRVVVHTPELSDNALVWKRSGGDAAALSEGGTAEGVVTKRATNATIRTYTGDNGRVSVRTIESPGTIDRARHWINLQTQSLFDISLPSIGLTMPAVEFEPRLPTIPLTG